MTFDPKAHMLNMKGKDYLEVKWRIVWFKDEHPNGSIQTEIVNYQPLVARAVIYNNEGVLVATGHGSANLNGKSAVWAGREVEKAETAAIGRALAHAGYGTQFDPDSDDADYLADSPIQRVGGTNQNSVKNSQTPVLSDLQNSMDDLTSRAETPVKSPAQRLGTPSKQTIAPKTGSWEYDLPALMSHPDVSKAYPQYEHRANAIKKLHSAGHFENVANISEAVKLLITRPDKVTA